jgi:hypothetical protein
MRTPHNRGRAALLALALLAAVVESAPAAAVAAAPDDPSVATAGAVVQSDLGTGWVPSGSTTAPKDQFGPSKIPECKAVNSAIVVRKTARAVSFEFTNTQASQISDTVGVYSTTAAASSAFDVIKTTAAQACIRKGLVSSLTSSAQAKKTIRKVGVKVSPVQVSTTGDDTVAYSLDITLTPKKGASTTLIAAIVGVRVARATVQVKFFGDPGATLFETVIANVVGRLGQAQAP